MLFARDVRALSPSKQSPFVVATIEYCFFDLGWEQVRIRLVLQHMFGIKENNAKSRVSKVIKSLEGVRDRLPREGAGLKRAPVPCDEDTEDAEAPPAKKPRMNSS